MAKIKKEHLLKMKNQTNEIATELMRLALGSNEAEGISAISRLLVELESTVGYYDNMLNPEPTNEKRV